MEYVIAKIDPKRKYPRNKYHPAMLNRECDIDCLIVGATGQLLVDMPYDPGYPHRFWTTPVKNIEELSDGTIVFETENTVYTLVKKENRNGILQENQHRI